MDAKIRNKLSKLIKETRGDRSYRGFAATLGVSHSTVQGWEVGNYAPDFYSLVAIARERRQTLTELLSEIIPEAAAESIRQSPKTAEDIKFYTKNLSVQEKSKLIKFLVDDLTERAVIVGDDTSVVGDDTDWYQ